MNMDELDILLSVIENPTRRRILEALVREPHYPLQLSRELGLSQQGIVKHLKVLEDYKLVRSYNEDSDQGPSRRIYVPTTGFTITVDIGPSLFSTEIITRVLDTPEEALEEVSEEQDRYWLRDIVVETRNDVAQIDEELGTLAKRRAELIKAKERALNEGYGKLESAIRDYQVRRVLFEFMQRPDLEASDIAQLLGLRDEDVERVMENILGGE